MFLDCDKFVHFRAAFRLRSRYRCRYNALTGGLSVLYSGVPAVTLPGEDFSSRMLASMLVFRGAAATPNNDTAFAY